MGGTTAKASIIEKGKLLRTDESEVGGGISLSSRLIKGNGYALKLPVIDISEVGAGGGSIAFIDKAGLLRVGPESAGAVPGPACYDAGGDQATVTDANVLLGYMNPHTIAGGTLPIRAERSKEVVERQIAGPLGQGLLQAAFGIHVVAASTMMRAIKAVSTYRGRDPRHFTMLAFGGNGGIFAVELARSLQMKEVIVPPAAGVFSAFGLLVSDIELIQTRAFLRRADSADPDELEMGFRELECGVQARVGDYSSPLELRREVAMRYVGQAFELTVPVVDRSISLASIRVVSSEFEAEHERTYGHRFSGDMPTEFVGLRVTGTRPPSSRPSLAISSLRRESAGTRACYFGPSHGLQETPVLARTDLDHEFRSGPLVIEEYEGTTVVPPNANARLDDTGNIIIAVVTGSAEA
jgi:N-methylhydantoinase A